MYHYVRPIKSSKYNKIRGLETDGFIRQIEYFRKNFNFITIEQLLDCIYNEKMIPDNSIMLTFDDGLKDHYQYVFPILKKLRIGGLFFPPAQPIEEKKVLDVQKIQFILSLCDDKNAIVNAIHEFIDQHQSSHNIYPFQTYFHNLATYDRFDSKEEVFIKKILQRELPRQLRNELVHQLFTKYVTSDQDAFSEDLYLSIDEIKEMNECGMYFGSHGYAHEWLGHLPPNELVYEIEKSIEFHHRINKNNENLIMCYPYGSYNESVIKELESRGFRAGLTTEVDDAEIIQAKAFLLKRYDTNDFPQ